MAMPFHLTVKLGTYLMKQKLRGVKKYPLIMEREPLMHPKIHEITAELLKRKKFVVLCTNAVFLPKHIDKFKPNKNFAWMVHLDGVGERHDEAVAKKGVFDQAVEAIKLAKSKGFA